jgi:hypothetical protein
VEAITRLVAESLARHGLDRPIDPRRLQWSRWFRCDSPHSLLVVPSKPGIFAIAEEITDLGASNVHVATDAFVRQNTSAAAAEPSGGAAQRCDPPAFKKAASAAEVTPKRMLAVLQFSEDDDMAFTLDRMFTRENPMRARLVSGRCFLRFVVIEDQDQRRSICNALNQWMVSNAEKASGLPADFLSSMELTSFRAGRMPVSANPGTVPTSAEAPRQKNLATPLDSGANTNLHCPHPLPSGF